MIYFVQGQRTQLVKIGYSTNKDTFKKRLSQLQCQNADTLVVLRTMAGRTADGIRPALETQEIPRAR